MHKADGTLLTIYQGLYNFTGTVTETNSGFSPNNTDNVGAKDESPRVVCTSENFNECNLDSLNSVSPKQLNDNLAKVINVTADYVLTGEESGYILEINSKSDITVIVPAGLQQGFQVEIVNITGVNVSFKAEENLLSYEGWTQLSGILSNAKLRNRGDKQWVLTGDLLASLK
ncbi:MAG: hypothetical protein ACKO3R_06405 [bacterium]